MVGIAEESISRNEKYLWISLDVGRRTSRLSEKPILLAARSLTSVIPLQTKLCTHLLWFWSMAEVYYKRKVFCTTLAPSFPLRNANWKRLQSKIVSSNFLKDATLRRKWSKYFIPRWHLDLCLPSNVLRYLPTLSQTKDDHWRRLCHIKEGKCHQSRESP